MVQGVLNCLDCHGRVWSNPDLTGLFWEGLDASGHFWRCPVASEYSFIELWVVCLQRSLVPVP